MPYRPGPSPPGPVELVTVLVTPPRAASAPREGIELMSYVNHVRTSSSNE